MKGNNVLGLIFANMHDSNITELTELRTMASVPFGGKYRLIDFPLSNMVNSGINNVGVVVKNNFFSLMDHVGSGKTWDLSRKNGGLNVLPPFVQGDGTGNNSLIEQAYSVRHYLDACTEEYILISDSSMVANIDYTDLIETHIKNGADFTVTYINTDIPENWKDPMVIKLGTDNRIEKIQINPTESKNCNMLAGCLLVNRQLILDLIRECMSNNQLAYKRYLFQQNLNKYKFYAYEHKGYYSLISSVNEYFKANMALMDADVRSKLFNASRPVYTKVRDDSPSRYGLGSSVKNSLISQGCIIEGTVENSIISKGVYIGKNTVVSNCVIMQDTKIGNDTRLNYVICDKDVVIKNERTLSGYESYPIYIKKESVV